MKKLFTLSIAAISFMAVSAQSPRLVLIEEGTNASCGPCAAQNPGFHTLLNANTEDVISIKYQTWWPGYDPMYEHNTADVTTRINYYNINGVPTAALDGKIITAAYPGFNAQYYAGAPGGFSQATLDHATSFTAPFDIELEYTLTPYEISITANATCTEAASGNLGFHIVVIEKEILFNSAPGSNGETEFYNVMKKMLPSAAGTAMPNTFAVGETFETTQSWNLANVYDIDQLAVVAFIQNNTGKAVLQAAYSDAGVLMPASDLDAAALQITGAEEPICEALVSPTLNIRNNGGNNLTSAIINYTLNDASGSINWTGDLAFYETAEISLGDIAFVANSTNTLTVTIENPNGASDDSPANNAASFDVEVAAETSNNIIVTVVADNYGNETYWRIVDEQGVVVAFAGNPNVGTNSGTGQTPTTGAGSYANGSTNTHNIALPSAQCYSFEIYDYFGDGICCQYGNGSYNVKNAANNEVLFSGGDFGANTANKMTANGTTVGIEEATALTSFNIFPNPTTDNLNIRFDLADAQHVSVDVLDILGKLIASYDYGMLSGENLRTINMDAHNQGMYMLVMNIGEQRSVKKFTLTK